MAELQLQHWGVIVSQPQRHRVAASSLAAEDFQFSIPQIEKLSVEHGRHVRKRYPLFGRYILVVINDFWQRLVHLRGVSGMLLTASGEPALVSNRKIEEINAMCVNGVYREPEIITQFVYGQKVRPKQGPLVSQVGLYDCRLGKKKEAALFWLFGRQQRVVFRRGELIAA